MAKGSNQKLKLLVLKDILMTYSDENHGLSIKEIIEKLESRGICAERKSLYDDLHLLQSYGCDICTSRDKTVKYWIASRDFELAELKLLADAVQSSKFITEKKSRELIKKVGSLASVYDAQKLQRQVYVANRVKTPNEKIYYTVDAIYEAISLSRQITFCYYRWSLKSDGAEKIVKEKKHGSKLYKASPLTLAWDDENYYLIAVDSESAQIRHYRVDKMENVELTDEPCGAKELESLDPALYSKGVFGMFGGELTDIKVSVDNSLVGVIADRFGKDVFVTRENEQRFIFSSKVVLSPQFYGWLFALGGGARLISPQWAADEYKAYLEQCLKMYS